MQILPELLTRSFIDEVNLRMIKESFSKIKACFDILSEEEIWQRPNANVNSIGNMILHLCGNVEQYILSGVDGQEDIRQRQKEFDRKEPIPKVVLIQKMETLLEEVKEILEGLTPEQMVEVRPVQCYEMSVMGMILHATEHFSYHTGQIIYYTKLVKEMDMKFYAGQNLDSKGKT